MKLSLYIGGRLADLSAGGTEALILWTYTREDASAPAAVKNSYTKTITLPATAANDTIFSHSGTLDRVTNTGMFDALRRTPFVIRAADGRVLERGYLKLDRVARRGEVKTSYDVTLYGGLGGFFYALSYNDDGTKRTLANMRWLTTSVQPTAANLVNPADLSIPALKQGWDALLDGSYMTTRYGILNYVPANNGIPDGNFDAGKAYVRQNSNQSPTADAGNLGGIETSVTKDGVTYTGPLNGGLGVIVDLGNDVTEWETQCFVPGYQREAWNLARFIQSLVIGSAAGDFGPWKFMVDEEDDFFNQQAGNPYLWKTWVTLEPGDGAAQGLYPHLVGTKTPADYLLGFAKMFGLLFVQDTAAQTITLVTRDRYYNSGLADIDLSKRVAGEVSVRAFVPTTRMYSFSVPTDGAFAETYEAKYGRTYGDFLLDSGFGFDGDTISVMESLPFNGCADVIETSPWYFYKPKYASGSITPYCYIKFVEYGEVTYQLVSGTKSLKITPSSDETWRSPYRSGYKGIDALPQFHDAENRRSKAPDVLLFLDGYMDLPQTASPYTNAWHIGSFKSDDYTAGKDVWNLSLSAGVTRVTRLPYFRRFTGAGQDNVYLDFGEANERADGYTTNRDEYYVYETRWAKYMRDRFDRDTMVITASVDFSGIEVGPALLRRFFYFRNSIWSLNKITDYNPARPGDLVKCEFVRVQDKNNYIAGQMTLTSE